MDSGLGDRDADMQQICYPNVDTKLVSKRIEVLRKYFDEDREVLDVWAKGEVLAIPEMKQKESTTENKRATEKRKENKERKPLGDFNTGRGIHGQGWCEPKKATSVEEKVE